MSLDKQHWTFYKYQLLVTHAMIAWHIKMEKLMVNAWIVMDISYVQSKIKTLWCLFWMHLQYNWAWCVCWIWWNSVFFRISKTYKILKTSRIFFLLKIPAQEMTEFVIALFTVVVFDFEQQHSWLGVTDDVRWLHAQLILLSIVVFSNTVYAYSSCWTQVFYRPCWIQMIFCIGILA